MNKNKVITFFCCILILAMVPSCSIPREKQTLNADIGLRIGSGDDITGLLLKQIIGADKDIEIENIQAVGESEEVLQDFTFKDC